MALSALPNYQDCAKTLSNNNIAVSAAELHGLLSGMLCAGVDKKPDWLILLYDYTTQGDAWPTNAKAMAESLFNQTASDLKSTDMDFTLLQPEQNTSLSEQAQALTDWVNGFLAGFGIAGASKTSSVDSKEILEDLAQIAQLGIDEDENESEQLALLSEVQEHVRICILSLYADNLLGVTSQTPRALH